MSSTTRKTTRSIQGEGLFGSATIDMHCCILTLNIFLISTYQTCWQETRGQSESATHSPFTLWPRPRRDIWKSVTLEEWRHCTKKGDDCLTQIEIRHIRHQTLVKLREKREGFSWRSPLIAMCLTFFFFLFFGVLCLFLGTFLNA